MILPSEDWNGHTHYHVAFTHAGEFALYVGGPDYTPVGIAMASVRELLICYCLNLDLDRVEEIEQAALEELQFVASPDDHGKH